MSCIYLLLGSNQGNRIAFLQRAISLLKDQVGEIIQLSKVYETAPWGNQQQPSFLNQVLSLRTNLEPHTLLDRIQEIEASCGRQRSEHWGRRTMDIDLLFYDNLILNDSPQLVIPHPLIPQRRFVLIPLAEIAPSLIHPVLLQRIDSLLFDCPDELCVTVVS